jgi:hypothetical protein
MSAIIRDFHPQATKLAETEIGLLPIYTKVLAGKKATGLDADHPEIMGCELARDLEVRANLARAGMHPKR